MESQQPELKTFTIFRKLPPELKVKVWLETTGLTDEPRVLPFTLAASEISENKWCSIYGSTELQFVPKPTADLVRAYRDIRAIKSTCKEAFEELRRRYQTLASSGVVSSVFGPLMT